MELARKFDLRRDVLPTMKNSSRDDPRCRFNVRTAVSFVVYFSPLYYCGMSLLF